MKTNASVALLVVVAALVVSPVQAAKRGRAASPAPAAPVSPASNPSSFNATISPDETPGDLLTRTRAAFAALEYDAVVALANAVLDRPKATSEQRLDAYLLLGSALAIVGDPIEAERPFRLLLRMGPGFDVPAETPPKILGVFRKVQVEERALAEQAHELERRRLIESIAVVGTPPATGKGGQPLEVVFELRDPKNAVATMNLVYRKRGERGFSPLALHRDDRGFWRGALPGVWTQSEADYAVELYLTTADANGEGLITLGSADAPLVVPVAAGLLVDEVPLTENPWFWGVTTVAALAVASTAGIAGLVAFDAATRPPDGAIGVVDLR